MNRAHDDGTIKRNTTAFGRDDFVLAYMAAFVAMGIAPGERMAKELADITHGASDCLMAVREMARAPEGGRVFAALDLLRPRHEAFLRSKDQKVAT